MHNFAVFKLYAIILFCLHSWSLFMTVLSLFLHVFLTLHLILYPFSSLLLHPLTVFSYPNPLQVFSDACLNTPIGAHDITAGADFYVALSSLITSNIEVKRWIFKLNIDYNNEGYAFLDVDR